METERKEDFKRRLLKLKNEYEREVEGLGQNCLHTCAKEQAGDLSSYSIHMADISGDVYEQEKEIGIMGKASLTLQKIDEALLRIEKEGFGVCQNCQKEISPDRLEAMPFAKFCIDCERKR
ncbi:MAG: TraR/DksA C4-type zinc finger protein [Candidatus Desantisbacteria bacterium]